MKKIAMTVDDYETLVNALRGDRMGPKDMRDGLVTQTADHPEYGAIVIAMDMTAGQGCMFVRDFDIGHG